MTFLHPQWLAALALPVILAFWEWVRRGQPMALPFDHGRQRRGLVLRFFVQCANCLPGRVGATHQLATNIKYVSYTDRADIALKTILLIGIPDFRRYICECRAWEQIIEQNVGIDERSDHLYFSMR